MEVVTQCAVEDVRPREFCRQAVCVSDDDRLDTPQRAGRQSKTTINQFVSPTTRDSIYHNVPDVKVRRPLAVCVSDDTINSYLI